LFLFMMLTPRDRGPKSSVVVFQASFGHIPGIIWPYPRDRAKQGEKGGETVLFRLASPGPGRPRVDLSRETGARQSGGHGETGGEIGRGNSASGTSPDSARQGSRQGAGQEGETLRASQEARMRCVRLVSRDSGGRGRARQGTSETWRGKADSGRQAQTDSAGQGPRQGGARQGETGVETAPSPVVSPPVSRDRITCNLVSVRVSQ
jgi:hypothetical protein